MVAVIAKVGRQGHDNARVLCIAHNEADQRLETFQAVPAQSHACVMPYVAAHQPAVTAAEQRSRRACLPDALEFVC